jgi:hypothetical protein
MQVIAKEGSFELNTLDISALPEAQREPKRSRCARKQSIVRPRAPGAGGLLRLRLMSTC